MDLFILGISIFVVVRWYKLSKIREEKLNLEIEALELQLNVKVEESVSNGKGKN